MKTSKSLLIASLMVTSACGASGTGDPDAATDSRADARVVDAAPLDAIAAVSLCEGVLSVAAPGGLAVSSLSGMVPLCGTLVVIGDRDQPALAVLNLRTGLEVLRVALAAEPGDIVVDHDRELAYVAVPAVAQIVRVDLARGGAQTPIQLSGPVGHLALANDQHLFASIAVQPPGFFDLAYVDGDAGVVVKLFETSGLSDELRYRSMLAYDSDGDQLLMGNRAQTPAHLVRYRFDLDLLQLGDAQWRNLDIGNNGQRLVVSPDGDHVAYCVGSGNSDYDIFDISSDDISVVHGEWVLGSHPRAADFSSDAQRLAATDGELLMLFSVVDHDELGQWGVGFGDCLVPTIDRIAFAVEGDVLFGYTDCGFEDESGRIVWQTIPSLGKEP